MSGTVASAAREERRAEPRVPLGVAVVLRTSDSAAAGRTVDVSLSGIQIELFGALPAGPREVVLEVSLSEAEPASLRAVIVRRALTPEGRTLLAVRLVPGAAPTTVYRGPALTSKAPSAAPAPDGSPESMVALRQLRALGARLLELALEDGDAAPPAALVTWVGRLAGELGTPAPADVGSNKALFRGIAGMHRAVSERAQAVARGPAE